MDVVTLELAKKYCDTHGGTTVIANPTLTGTEEELSSIQIGNTKYSNLNYHPFPTGDVEQHLGFKVNGTLQEFGQSIVNYEYFATGCTWFGGIQCTDLPCGMGQVECKVTAIRDKTNFPRNIAIVEISSSNREPFYWIYNTDSWSVGETDYSDWKYVVTIDGSKIASMSANETGTVKVKKLSNGGLQFYIQKD